MGRKQVLVQLDDALVERLDEIAERVGTSRSELLRRGAQAVIGADEQAAADRDLQAAYLRQPPDGTLAESARRLAARTAPEW